MVQIIIASHGDFAKAIKESAELIVGKQEDIRTFSLKYGDSVENLKSEIKEAVLEMQKRGEVIVLTDMFSGSPFNATVSNMKELDFWHITGLNLPMLLEILIMRQTSSAEEICRKVVGLSKDSIKLVNDMLKKR